MKLNTFFKGTKTIIRDFFFLQIGSHLAWHENVVVSVVVVVVQSM